MTRQQAAIAGREIRELRERRGLTQHQLADALGTSARTVGNWERGESVPRNRMGMLREFFGLDVDAAADPLRSASEVALLGELMRRAVGRQVGQGQ